MSNCLFCGAPGPFRTRNHVVPESLGSSSEFLSRVSTTCDSCNSYFGAKVEAEAICGFPFGAIRLFCSIPDKKGKSKKVRVGSQAGDWTISSTGVAGSLGLNPPTAGKPTTMGLLTGRSLILSGQPGSAKERLAVCRLLLKMGIEMLAETDFERATSLLHLEARTFARAPVVGTEWVYFISVKNEFFEWIRESSYSEYLTDLRISLSQTEYGCSFFYELPGLQLCCPLFPHTPDPTIPLGNPEQFYVIAKCGK